MGLRMVMHQHTGFVIIAVDISNAYYEVEKAAVLERHMQHGRLREMMPYWRTNKIGPATKL
jgi:hypothetical protein